MHSIVIDGKVFDYKYKKINEFSYAFYIGGLLIGRVFKMKIYWSCISEKPNKLCPMDGFINRFYASEFLLKLNGYREVNND